MAAFACRPGRGSEPGAGWAAARAAVEGGHTVVLVTQPRHRAAVEAARQADPELAERLEVHYRGLSPRVMAAWDRLGLAGLPLYYLAWQVPLRRLARRLHGRRPFDVAHHVTLSCDWLPSGLAGLPGLPLVWGPLGGGERVPPGMRRWLGPAGRAQRLVHDGVTTVARALLARGSLRRADLVVAQNHDGARRLGGRPGPVAVRPHVALGPEDVATPRGPSGDGPHRAVFAGRLVTWKGVRLAVATLALPAARHWELHLFGAGPARRAVEADVRRLGLAGRVHLHGARPRSEVRAALAGADALLFPSLRDAAGWVVAEALAVGCPVVCLDLAGPAELVAGGRGIAVAPGPGADAALARALGAVGGLAPARFRWDVEALAADLTAWYRRAVGGAP